MREHTSSRLGFMMTMKKPATSVYKMSESGACSKALAATRLGYEYAPPSGGGGEVVMREGKRHEIHIAEDLAEMGYELEDAGECMQCREEFGATGIGGHHVEINTFLIRLIGHIDRYLVIDGQRFPCEFKSMGVFPYQKFKKEGLIGYPGYVSQEACYIGYMQKPGLYVVKDRNSGEMSIYTVPFGDVVIPGHTILPINMTLDAVLDKIHQVDVAVRGNELPDCDVEDRWCGFRYLCDKKVKAEEGLPEATQEELLEAVSIWREGKALEKDASDKVEFAKQVFLTTAKAGTPKFKVGGVSVSYAGQRTRKTLDSKMLRELVSKEIIKKAERESKPYDDISIREVGE